MVEAYFYRLRDEIDAPVLDWPGVERAYRGRPYHNLDHLDEMLERLTEHPQRPVDDVIFATALIYHDVVYKPTRKDNEARSARKARGILESTRGISQARIERCEQLIMCTKHHHPPHQDDGDGALLIDLDLAVLSRPTKGYERYRNAVRREFWMIPGFVYRKGRRKVLTSLLDRERIYHTDYAHEKHEGVARENLWRELRAL